MSVDNANIALARNLALLRLLARSLEEDDPPDRSSRSEVLYVLDANVVIFLVDPVNDRSLLQIFGGRAAFDLPEVATLVNAEEHLLAAFARDEADRLSRTLNKRATTHVARPHLFEVSWRRSRVHHDVVSRLSGRQAAALRQERMYIARIRSEIERAKKTGEADAKKVFEVFLENFLPSMVRQVEALQRLNGLIGKGALFDNRAKLWEASHRPHPALWRFFFERLMELRLKREKAKDVHFNVMQDAEALALLCGYARETSIQVTFVTFDWAIHRLFDSIYNTGAIEITEEVKRLLPPYNFTRHPIIYTALVSEFDEKACRFILRDFIRDIDLLFLKKSMMESELEQILGEIAYNNKLEHIGNLIGPGTEQFRQTLQPFADKLSKDILLFHEESAVHAVRSLVEPESSNPRLSDDAPKKKQASLDIALDMADYITERSDEKAAGLVKALVGISMLDSQSNRGELQTENAARLILQELDERSDGLPVSSRQLLRNFPGWIRLSSRELCVLNTIADDTLAFARSLLEAEASLDHHFFFLGALIAAIDDDWLLSEHHAIAAREKAVKAGALRSVCEAEYWVAVSRRHQRDPGIRKLLKAERNLRSALSKTSDALDRLRFESELAALGLSIPYHHYHYGDRYERPEGSKGASYTEIANRLDGLIRRFTQVARVPYQSLDIRLGIQLYSTRCLLNLFSWGVPPGSGSENPQARQPAEVHSKRLNQLCGMIRHSTLPVPVQFIQNACAYALAHDLNSLKAIEELLRNPDDILIPFDRRLISDFMKLASPKFGPR